ncbi:MAG: PQQ-binding-like beta-propeller repeat protein, partial [Sedimentisphaerales bacterium]
MVANSRNDSASEHVQASSLWYRCAVATAVLSAVFSIVVCAFILMNYGRSRMADTAEETALANLKLEIRSKPDDEQLLPRIRQFDLQVRQQRIRALDRSRKGSYLLLSGVVVFMISLRSAIAFKKKPPTPQPVADQLTEQVRNAKFARWAITGGLVILGSGSLFLATRPEIDFVQTGAAGTASYNMDDIAKNWASFRGLNGAGISTHANVPTRWSGKTGEGILWKTGIPLPGHNSPIVWGNSIFLSGGDPNELAVFCFDATSGKLLWRGDVTREPLKDGEEPLEPEDTGWAAPTAVTDGKHVYAMFVTGDIACFDFNGKKIWQKNLGTPENHYGHASSLAIYKNLVMIQYDQGIADDEMSAMIALDGFTGEIAWQTKRPVDCSWTSPIMARIDDQFQIITCSPPWVIAYEPTKGTELWRADCLSGELAASPIYAGGFVFAIVPGEKLVAIRPDGKGDVTQTHIAWSMEEWGPTICSPISDGERIVMLGADGLISCHKTSDGSKLWEHELDEYFTASPSLVGKNVYLLDQEGGMFIIELGDEFKELAKYELGEECYASPAFADGRIYIRGVKHLYCIGNKDSTSASPQDPSKNWASFRGPNGAGISTNANVPTRWGGKTGEGILWKTEIPLPGHNSPVIWGDRVFLSGADPNNRQVYCFDASTGGLLWKGNVLGLPKSSNEEPLEVMEDTGLAAPTVVTDGRRVYAIFPTGDVGCFDFKGKKVWEKNLGRPDSSYGYSSSLAMYQNLLLIQYDQGGIEDNMSELIAVDGFSGRVVWQKKRPVGNSWSSPIVASIGEQFQVITCADPWVIAYNPADGAELWRANCLSGDVAPSPIYANGLVFVIEPYSKLVAIKPDGKGDVTETHIAWISEEGGPDICSPVSNGESIFLLATEGLLECYNVSDGKRLWEKDLQEYFLASPSLVDNKLYLLSDKGVMFIADAESEYKELAKCELDEKCHASPAFADGRIYIRGVENLYCIG